MRALEVFFVDGEAVFSDGLLWNSIVKLATDKETGVNVAIKIIEKKNVGDAYKKNLQTETEILRKVQHANIIKLIEMYDTDEYLFLVMELVVGGELFDRIVEKGAYSEAEASTLVRHIVKAILYLHEMDICHRDLKPENLLLATRESDTDIKISDFGLSKIISTKVMMQTACGTPGYVAPEVLNATGYDKEVDMWSVGVITYILLCGFPPFYGDTVPQLFEQILQGRFDYPEDYWAQVSESAVDFINHLLVVDKDKRFTAQQALAHPWLNVAQSDKALPIASDLRNLVAKHKAQSAHFAGSFDV